MASATGRALLDRVLEPTATSGQVEQRPHRRAPRRLRRGREILKAVAVAGPCLPALTLEQQLLKGYYQERFEKGFEYSFIVPRGGGSAANARQLAAIPSRTDNRASQMEDMPRSNTANTEMRTGVPSSG